MVLSKACITVAIINATAACRRPEIEGRVASRVIPSCGGSAPREAVLYHPTRTKPPVARLRTLSATLGPRRQKTITSSSEEHQFVSVFLAFYYLKHLKSCRFSIRSV